MSPKSGHSENNQKDWKDRFRKSKPSREKEQDVSKSTGGKDDGTNRMHRKEIDELKEKCESEKTSIRDYLLNSHADEKKRLQSTHEADKIALQDRLLKSYRAENSRLESTHQAEKRALQKEFDTERKLLRSTISEWQQRLESEKAHLSAKISSMQEEHNSDKARMEKHYESDRLKLLTRMTEAKEEHKIKQEQMMRDSNDTKTQLEHQRIEEVARLKSEFETRELQLEMSHAAETKRLRRDIEAYSGALLARDEFKPIPDDEIKSRFMDLAQEIDALARIEWRPNQKEWTNQLIRRLSNHQRMLKKQILQDILWVTLHENIFCSPFRVFGAEGRSLELEWNDDYGKDSHLDNGSYVWPEPSVDAERWRYAAVKECRAALEKPASKWDPRATLKRSFKTSFDALKEELMSRLNEVSSVDDRCLQAVESIIKKAAKMWLDFGTQRCRIMVVVQGSNLKSAQEKIQTARSNTLKLVVVPELKKFGNSKGQDVDVQETVGECGGEIVEVVMQP